MTLEWRGSVRRRVPYVEWRSLRGCPAGRHDDAEKDETWEKKRTPRS
ncbi:hypothetical protein [Nonomuraea soli]|uniref:Uncharacterized protein n=1 Tax=Nonomuraea soli TaxID=1032476 RepID=A0A7W0HQS9_9ACTN|nr:hypothetical protein [Nonomuraea soli]MBA2892283.1 hypothetical protein [Nonomuraea soli]